MKKNTYMYVYKQVTLLYSRNKHNTVSQQCFNKINFKKLLRSSSRGSVITNPTGTHEDAGLIPGLAQWVKDPELLLAAVLVTDVAWIWCCCGCGVSWQLQLQFNL